MKKDNRSITFIIFLSLMITGIFPNTVSAGSYLEQGKKYYIYRKYDKAKELLTKAIEQNENNGDAHYFLGEIEKIQGNYSAAEVHYSNAVEFRTTKKYKKNAFWNLIIFAEQKGDRNAVIKICKQMWDKIKDKSAKSKIESLINKMLWSENRDAVALYKKGRELLKRRKKDKAKEQFTNAINTDYSFLAPKFEMAMILYESGDYYNASSYLTEVVRTIPFYAEAQLVLSDIHLRNRNYSQAIDSLNKAYEFGLLDKSTRYQVHFKRATAYYALRDLENASSAAQEAIKLRGKRIELHLLLSAIFIKQGDYDNAMKSLKKAEKINRNKPAVLFQIGSIYYRQDDWRFLSYFDRLFNIVKSKKRDTSAYSKAFAILAEAHYERKNYNRSFQVINFTKESHTFKEKLLMARNLYYLGKYDQSIDVFENLSLSDDDRFLLCKAYARSGRNDRAKELLKYLIFNESYAVKAKSDRFLRPLLRELESEQQNLNNQQNTPNTTNNKKTESIPAIEKESKVP